MKDNEEKRNSAVDKVEKLSVNPEKENGLNDSVEDANYFGEGINAENGLNGTENLFGGVGINGIGLNGVGGVNGASGVNGVGGVNGTGIPPIMPIIGESEREAKEREEAAIKRAEEKEEKKRVKEKAEKNEKISKANKKILRAERREMLKNETEYEREKRIIAEKQAKFRMKEARASRKSEERERRAEFKEGRRRNRQSRGLGGWIATVVTLSVVTLILGGLLAFDLFGDRINIGQPSASEAEAQRAYYDFVGYVDNIDTDMSKFFVSGDKEGRQKILGELMVKSSLADAALSQLPMHDEAKYLTSKYINQIGDYAKYLNNRLIEGQTLTQDDYSRLSDLYEINVRLKNSLGELNAEMAKGYDFSSLTSGVDGDAITERFTDMENSAKDYPEMIYDGPFSDGLDGIKPKGLNYENVTEEEVKGKFKSLFTFYDMDGIEVVGKSENGKIETFNVKGDIKEGGEAYAQFSVKGGKLVLFTAFRDCKNENYGENECQKTAEEFLKNAGFDDMKLVWEYSAGNTMHYNFVYEKDGILFYPDMVKVNVCRETLRVSGVDADAYYMNHTEERDFGTHLKSMEEAAAKLDKKLAVKSADAVVIPIGNGKERAAYEFIATYGGSTYYVYIDAETLKQADIFKVIDTAEGRLLI